MNKGTLAALFLLTSTLISCGIQIDPIGEKPDLSSYLNQKVDWKACPTTILGRDSSKDFKLLGKRLTCADIKAPLDWKDPNKGEIFVSLLKVSASKPEQKQGALFFNPGGPGGDGLSLALYRALAWETDKKKSKIPKIAAGLKQLTEQYDFIGFSPRGTGNSSRMYCGGNELSPVIKSPASDRSDQNIANMIRTGQLHARACQKNPMTPYVNTEATVQDMNLARHLLKEEKLNLVGYSYGTWLGSWFAKRFPEQTGRMLLDSSADFSRQFQETFKGQPFARQKAFREIVAPYVAKNNKIFNLGDDPQTIYAIHDQLSEPLRDLIGRIISSNSYNRNRISETGFILNAAKKIDQVVKKNPDISYEDLLKEANEIKYNNDPDLNQITLELAKELIIIRDDILNAEPEDTELTQFDATFYAVACGDDGWSQDLKEWRAFDDKTAKEAPVYGGRMLDLACLHWKLNTFADKPNTPNKMPPLLVLQSEYDSATYAEGALNAVANTPNTKLIYVKDEPEHGIFPYNTECVDLPVIDYFLNGKLPSKDRLDCEAKPLPLPSDEVTANTLTIFSKPNGDRCLTTTDKLNSLATSTPASRANQRARALLNKNALGAHQFEKLKLKSTLPICE